MLKADHFDSIDFNTIARQSHFSHGDYLLRPVEYSILSRLVADRRLEQFTDFYYNTFDTNPKNLAALYVRVCSILCNRVLTTYC